MNYSGSSNLHLFYFYNPFYQSKLCLKKESQTNKDYSIKIVAMMFLRPIAEDHGIKMRQNSVTFVFEWI